RLVVTGDHEPGFFALAHGNQLRRADRPHGSIGGLVTQGLAGEPVLTVAAMQVTAQHAEGQGVAARVDMEKRLLFHRVALQTADVTERHLELTAFVEADLADAALARAD